MAQIRAGSGKVIIKINVKGIGTEPALSLSKGVSDPHERGLRGVGVRGRVSCL
jgi:hypothetical protein